MEELLHECLNKVEEINNYPLLAPENINPPYMVYQTISDNYTTYLSGTDTSLKNVRFQVDVYAKTYFEAKRLSTQAINKIISCDTFKSVIYSTSHTQEDTGKTFRVLIDFKLWN